MLARRLIILLCLPLILVNCSSENSEHSAVKKRMLLEHQAQYQGSCPCPQSFGKNRVRCGDDSVYTKNDGKSPLCYESDITDEMLAEYMKRSK